MSENVTRALFRDVSDMMNHHRLTRKNDMGCGMLRIGSNRKYAHY
jgi:hypothetical protein